MTKNKKNFLRSFFFLGIPAILIVSVGIWNVFRSITEQNHVLFGHERLFLVVLFVCGYILQFISLIILNHSVKEKRFVGKLLTSLLVGAVLFILPGKGETSYDIFFHSFFALIIFGVYFSAAMKESLSPRINEQTVLIWILLLGYLLLANHVSVIWWYFFLPVALFSILNIYTDWDQYTSVRVILYTLFLVIITSVSLIHLHLSDLGFFFNGERTASWINGNAFAAGMLLGYLTPYIVYLLRLWPFPGKNQKWKSRKKELQQVIADFAQYFDPHKNFPLRNTCIAIFTILFLYLNYAYALISQAYTIALVLVLVRIIDIAVEARRNNMVPEKPRAVES